jgi:hypothetical protein
MPVDLNDILTRGGKDLIDLLHFSVYSLQLEPMFVHLVQDYRNQATVNRALALFDVFCTVGSPACIRATDLLPPRDLRLLRELTPLRQPTQPAPLSARHLFDFVVALLREQTDGPLHMIAQQYDPARSPIDNLPAGRLSQTQRFFVEKVWQGRLRPQLVSAGFWRVATIGG